MEGGVGRSSKEGVVVEVIAEGDGEGITKGGGEAGEKGGWEGKGDTVFNQGVVGVSMASKALGLISEDKDGGAGRAAV